jgi:hypothetical protein
MSFIKIIHGTNKETIVNSSKILTVNMIETPEFNEVKTLAENYFGAGRYANFTKQSDGKPLAGDDAIKPTGSDVIDLILDFHPAGLVDRSYIGPKFEKSGLFNVSGTSKQIRIVGSGFTEETKKRVANAVVLSVVKNDVVELKPSGIEKFDEVIFDYPDVSSYAQTAMIGEGLLDADSSIILKRLNIFSEFD